MTIELVYRVRCSGPCRRWLSLPDDYEPGEDLPLATLVPKPTAARAGLWPDETAARRAAFAAGWSSGTCPDCRTAEQDAPRREPHPTQADVDHALAVAAKFQGQATDADRIVAYRLGTNTGLHCVGCAPSPRGDIWEPVTSEDLPDGGACSKCGVDVLIEQESRS